MAYLSITCGRFPRHLRRHYFAGPGSQLNYVLRIAERAFHQSVAAVSGVNERGSRVLMTFAQAIRLIRQVWKKKMAIAESGWAFGTTTELAALLIRM